MQRIKVTGYINLEDLHDDEIDLSDETGLAEGAFLKINQHLASYMGDIDFKLMREGF